ncbi:MAG: hypothetical protein LLG05_12545 [Porphyromonadaceae bacterium]|nr:hypothetical protein [Porphyromonadaceae bacterium]
MSERKDEDILNEAKSRYEVASQGWEHIYGALKDDFKFVYDVDGGQWSEESLYQRAGRPCLTVNKLQKFVRQLRGDMMQNRPRVKTIPVDSKADPKKAELFNGLIREIEYLSSAEIAYDTAYTHAVSGSVGFFRIVTEYADGDTFEQDIRIKRIINPTAVYFDPNAVEFCMQDARYCFIESLIDKDDFIKQYPDEEVIDFNGNPDLYGSWLQDNKVRIAEYFTKEPVKKKIVQLHTGEIVELTTKEKQRIELSGDQIVQEREVDTHKVMWYKICGTKILQKAEWPGKDIPIIPVFGDEIVAGGKKYYLSLTRGAKGSQQMYNYWASAATENVMMSPKNPYIVDHRQIKGFESEWEEANIKNRMFIRYNAVNGLQKPSRESQVQVPNAIVNMMQSTAYDIEDHLGRYEASKGEASNERSGKAIVARINQSDKGTYTFVDNLARAIIYCGRQLIDLIPKIYDTPRALRVMGEEGSESLEIVNSPTMGPDGEVKIENDLSVGKFDLIASTGPSYGSQRQEMVQMMIESMQYAPGIAPVLAPLIFKYSDWPGSQEVFATLQGALQQAQETPPE